MWYITLTNELIYIVLPAHCVGGDDCGKGLLSISLDWESWLTILFLSPRERDCNPNEKLYFYESNRVFMCVSMMYLMITSIHQCIVSCSTIRAICNPWKYLEPNEIISHNAKFWIPWGRPYRSFVDNKNTNWLTFIWSFIDTSRIFSWKEKYTFCITSIRTLPWHKNDKLYIQSYVMSSNIFCLIYLTSDKVHM